MIEVKLRKGLKHHKVMMYDSIDNMPIVLFSKMQKYQIVESGIGANIADFDQHFEKTVDFLKHDKKDKAINELSNIRHLFWHSLNEVDPSHLAFCCLVYSIDGKEITDHSEQSLEEIREKLSSIGLTEKLIRENELKKKSMTN